MKSVLKRRYDHYKVAGDYFFNYLNLHFVFKFLIKMLNLNFDFFSIFDGAQIFHLQF